MNQTLWKSRRFFVFAAFILTLVAGMMLWSCSSDERIAGSGQQPAPLGMWATDLNAAIEIQNRNTAPLMAVTGVVGTGITETPDGRYALMVLTEDKSVAGIPQSIEGMPTIIEPSGRFKAFALTRRYRPVPIGVSVGNFNECSAGTIGCQVEIGGELYVLSNNHVLARENDAAIGEDIVQPGRYDRRCRNYLSTDYVGDLADFEPLRFNGQNNTIDAAVARYSTSDVSCATLSNYYGFPSSTPVAAFAGQAIMKVGRTTSQSTGSVVAVNVTSNVGYSSGVARFVGQIYTSGNFSRSGDSGSLVVTNDGNKNPVGLLFAGTNQGNSLLNPIGVVLSRFNATICSQ
jgi:hypothetical protein